MRAILFFVYFFLTTPVASCTIFFVTIEVLKIINSAEESIRLDSIILILEKEIN